MAHRVRHELRHEQREGGRLDGGDIALLDEPPDGRASDRRRLRVALETQSQELDRLAGGRSHVRVVQRLAQLGEAGGAGDRGRARFSNANASSAPVLCTADLSVDGLLQHGYRADIELALDPHRQVSRSSGSLTSSLTGRDLRHGEVIRVRIFTDRHEPLPAAGVSDQVIRSSTTTITGCARQRWTTAARRDLPIRTDWAASAGLGALAGG